MSYIVLKMIIHKKDQYAAKDQRIAGIGAVCGPRGMKAIDLLYMFDDIVNKKYPNIKDIVPFNVKVYAFLDQRGKVSSFEVDVQIPSTTFWLKKFSNIDKFSSLPGKKGIFIDRSVFDQVVDIKLSNSSLSRDIIEKSVLGTIKSCGLILK